MSETTPFVINDRRGQKKEPRVDVIAEPVEQKDRSFWKNVGNMIVMVNSQQGIIPIARSVGLRSDDECMIADWMIPPLLVEGQDITEFSRKRLDTFLNCECGNRKMCSEHNRLMPQWMQQDSERLNRMATEPVPPAIEVMMKAEMARRNSGIVTPGR